MSNMYYSQKFRIKLSMTWNRAVNLMCIPCKEQIHVVHLFKIANNAKANVVYIALFFPLSLYLFSLFVICKMLLALTDGMRIISGLRVDEQFQQAVLVDICVDGRVLCVYISVYVKYMPAHLFIRQKLQQTGSEFNALKLQLKHSVFPTPFGVDEKLNWLICQYV